MKSKPRILAIIPARSGSKRLKNKNILSINGIPMWRFTWDMVCKSKLKDTAVIATDIKVLYNEPRLNIIKRPKELCTDKSPLDDTLKWVVEQYKKHGMEFDYICMTHCNIPIRKDGEIDKLIKIALKNPDATSVVSGYRATEVPEWMFEKCKDGYYKRNRIIGNVNGREQKEMDKYRKQDMPVRLIPDGAIQIHKTLALMAGTGKAFSYFGNKIIVIEHERKFGLEIDDIETFNYVEYLMKGE